MPLQSIVRLKTFTIAAKVLRQAGLVVRVYCFYNLREPVLWRSAGDQRATGLEAATQVDVGRDRVGRDGHLQPRARAYSSRPRHRG